MNMRCSSPFAWTTWISVGFVAAPSTITRRTKRATTGAEGVMRRHDGGVPAASIVVALQRLEVAGERAAHGVDEGLQFRGGGEIDDAGGPCRERW